MDHPLKIERKLRGWSQSRIAEALGITTRTVSRWEQGLSMPYPYYREQLCALFGKNARELGMLSESDENAPQSIQSLQNRIAMHSDVVEEAIPLDMPPAGGAE